MKNDLLKTRMQKIVTYANYYYLFMVMVLLYFKLVQ